MKLVRIGWESWEVLAVCDPRGRCQVLDFLLGFKESSPAAARGMLALLRRELPAEGPPKGEPLCKSLGNGIYELRKQPKGKKLRVVWFYGVDAEGASLEEVARPLSAADEAGEAGVLTPTGAAAAP